MPLPDQTEIAARAHLLPLLRAAMRAIDAGQTGQAEPLVDSILAQAPDFADALHLKGMIELHRGHLSEAAKWVERAIATDFHFENYHQTLGHIRLAEGDLDAAEKAFGTALTLNDKNIDAYIGLAHLRIAQGRLEEAKGVLRQSKLVQGDHAEARFLMGYVEMALGNLKGANIHFSMALAKNPNELRYRSGFARSLRGLKVKSPAPELIKRVLPLLGAPGIEPRDMVSVAESALLIDPILHSLLPLGGQPAQLAARMAEADFPDLAGHELLIAWLRHGLVTSQKLERLFTSLRHAALITALKNPADLDRHAPWLDALARRNFHAEYVDAETPAEKAGLARIDLALTRLDPAAAPGLFALYGSYRPLYRRDDAEALAAKPWPPVLIDLKRSQLTEPLAERRIGAALPALTPIEDQVSRAVQEMYEESPFPRWNQPVMGTPLPVVQHVRSALPLQLIPALEASKPRILVAGCGTGLHAILAATSYQDGSTTAIDLSRASLSYAKRKATELGIRNLDFYQADILKVGALDKRFHVIECFGVLHHMRDPDAGLAQLVKLLLPGGYMMLGLYSELGRRDVVAARAVIAEHGYSDTPDDIRRFRMDLDRLAPELASRLRRSSAYHTLSDIRDLLFHRQEHRYFPHQLRAMIDKAGLEFLGFEFTSPQPLAHYREQYPDDPRAVSLANWAKVEEANPDLFGNCYRFWLRKPA